jgi:hypothetical protein
VSAIQQVMLGLGGTVSRGTITVGVSGSNAGYSVTGVPYGSKTVNDVDGEALRAVISTTTLDLVVNINDANDEGGQSFFKAIHIEDGTGTVRSYQTSDATYSIVETNNGQWAWGDGASRVFETTDDTETHSVSFVI